MKSIITKCVAIVLLLVQNYQNGFSQNLINAGPGNNWRMGGNINANGTGSTVFGPTFNQSIFTITAGLHRTRLNGTLTATINSVSQNVSGFFGIAPNGYFATNSPAALLHLYGINNTNFGIGGGWRRWMQSGIFINEHSDAMYIGMKPETGTLGNVTNRSDAVIAWNDDAGAGEDKLRFIFTATNPGASGNGNGNNPIDGRSLNGYEFMRLSSSPTQTNGAGFRPGNIGIGPVFTDNAPPQNRLHINAEGVLSNWFQMSIQNSTGQANTDGLKMGILADNTANIQNGNAFFYNQEQRHIIFSTGYPTPGNVSTTNERVRLTSLDNPTNLPNGTYGTYNPAGIAGRITRVAISHDPTVPVTRPLSLLHIGYNTGAFTAGSTDGWRPWMDLGIFSSSGSDNVYLGFKNEGNVLDRMDAVLNWGDNPATGTTGPDYFRFVFTAQSVAGPGIGADKADGLEIARMAPNGNVGIGNFYNNPIYAFRDPARRLEVLSDKLTANVNGTPQFRLTHTQQNPATPATTGKFSDFTETLNGDLVIEPRDNTKTNSATQILKNRFIGINTLIPGNTVEINSQLVSPTTANPNVPGQTGESGLRLSDLTSLSTPVVTNPGPGVLSVNSTGDVIYVPGGGATSANNGIFSSSGTVQLGGACAIPAQISASQFTGSRALDLDNFNFEYRRGRVGFGTTSCTPSNRVEITGLAAGQSGLSFSNISSGSVPITNPGTGVLALSPNGTVIYVPAGTGGTGVGNYCSAAPSPLTGHYEVPLSNFNYYFSGQGNSNVGIGLPCGFSKRAKLHVYETKLHTLFAPNLGYSTTARFDNNSGALVAIGAMGNSIGFPLVVGTTTYNYGGYFEALNGTINVGVYGKAFPASTTNFAGYFVGNVHINGTGYINSAWSTSDQTFKTNINPISTSLTTINRLTPKSFYFDTLNTSGFNFPSQKQYGFIAQDVETILPELVTSTTKLADYDTLGNLVHPAVTFKTLNYNAFIGILTKGIQELDSSITSVLNKGVIASGSPLVNNLTKFTDSTTIANSQIFDDGTNVGINTSTPNNKLEINSGIANTSGLTFTNLTLASAADAPNGKVLSVNSSGAVVLTCGTVGATGATGTNGLNGATGSTGNTGATGTNGTIGATGNTGNTGAVGATGANGLNGATGTTGPTGATGADGSQNAWSRTGNAGTVDGTNFIGTTDAVPFNIRVNNQKAGRIDLTTHSTFYGYQAGNANTGPYNTANGYSALYSNTTGGLNTAVGESALNANTTGEQNTGNGFRALYSNTTGLRNTAIGAHALYLNTTGNVNTATGMYALFSNTTGSENTATGSEALVGNTEGFKNTSIGYSSLHQNSIGSYNTATGYRSLHENTSGNQNTATGNYALYNNTTGSQNTGLGYVAGYANVTGIYNTYLGYNANSSDGLTNATAIGANAFVTASNALVLGSGANVGIGVTAPAYKLDVNGDVNVNGTYRQNGNMFTSDQQFKTAVDSISNALSLINQLKPRSFYFDTANVYGLNFNEQKQYGLIAQDVEQVLPELVSNTTKTATYDTAGTLLTPGLTYKVLNYNAFTAITLKAIQELSRENDSLKIKTNNQDSINTLQMQTINNLSQGLLAEQTKTDSMNTFMQNQLNQMMTAINSCCKKTHDDRSLQLPANNDQSITTLTDVALSNKNVIVLDQNVPNPFAEQTSINYYLPDNVQRAQILFFEQSGKIIKTVDLTEKGKGVLNVFANDLSNGIYTYSLIVDGQIVETKKMVKQ